MEKIKAIKLDQNPEIVEIEPSMDAIRKFFDFSTIGLVKGPEGSMILFDKGRSRNPNLPTRYTIYDRIKNTKIEIKGEVLILKGLFMSFEPKILKQYKTIFNKERLNDFLY